MIDAEKEEVEASLSIQLNVECPHCEDFFDLLEHKDEVQGFMNEEGGVIMHCCPSGDWTERHRDYSEDVTCPTCKKIIKVRGIAW